MGDSRPHALLWKTEGGPLSRGGTGPPRTQGNIRKHSLSTTPVTGDQLKLFPREPEHSVTGQVPCPWIELLSSVTRKPIIGQIVYSQSWSHSGNSPRGSGRGWGVGIKTEPFEKCKCPLWNFWGALVFGVRISAWPLTELLSYSSGFLFLEACSLWIVLIKPSLGN